MNSQRPIVLPVGLVFIVVGLLMAFGFGGFQLIESYNVARDAGREALAEIMRSGTIYVAMMGVCLTMVGCVFTIMGIMESRIRRRP